VRLKIKQISGTPTLPAHVAKVVLLHASTRRATRMRNGKIRHGP